MDWRKTLDTFAMRGAQALGFFVIFLLLALVLGLFMRAEPLLSEAGGVHLLSLDWFPSPMTLFTSNQSLSDVRDGAHIYDAAGKLRLTEIHVDKVREDSVLFSAVEIDATGNPSSRIAYLASSSDSSLLIQQPGRFGLFPFLAGTIFTTFIALLIAAPICFFASIYLAEYAPASLRRWAGLLIDILAGVPSVVFGLWGLLFIVPLVRDVIAPAFGAKSAGFSVLAAAIVLALMVCPIIISLSVEVIRAVPRSLREASMGLGATRAQTLLRVLLPQSLSGLVAANVLGFSRAIGETMAVMMVVGSVPLAPYSVFDPAYPLTALIANGYSEMMSIPLYDSALMLAALVLLVVVLIFNLMARAILKQMRSAGAGKRAAWASKVR